MKAAKQGDVIVGTDVHPGLMDEEYPAVFSCGFRGSIEKGISEDVLIGGKGAVVVGASAQTEKPPHLPPPGGTFVPEPTGIASVIVGSATVLINGKPAGRHGDRAVTCSVGPPSGSVEVLVDADVFIGG